MLSRILSQLLFLLIFACGYSQNIYISTGIPGYDGGSIFKFDSSGNSTFITNVVLKKGLTLSDIAIAPNKKIYGVTLASNYNPSSIVEIDISTGETTEICQLLNLAPVSLVCSKDYELYTIDNNSTNLYKYDILKDTLLLVTKLNVTTPGDLTFLNGHLIFQTNFSTDFGDINSLKAFNLADNSQIDIYCFNKQIGYSYGITNDFSDCNKNRIINCVSFDNRCYEIDLLTQSENSIINGLEYKQDKIYGLASYTEYKASECTGFQFDDLKCNNLTLVNNAYLENSILNDLSLNSSMNIDQIEIYNLNGQLIKKITSPKPEDMNLEILQNGIYIVKILYNSSLTTVIRTIQSN